jgi:zinc and cadmium transporter
MTLTHSTLYTLGSVLLTSSVALVCLVLLGWDEVNLKRRIPLMIAVTVGVLLGEAVFHLLPEALRKGIPVATTMGLAVLGIGFSYGIELLCKGFLPESKYAPVARISLIAESVHNGIDGAIIAAAYIAGIRVGLIATVAILLHELPHELGNFSVLVHGGYERSRALLLNCLSASVAFVGAATVILAGKELSSLATYVLPASAGCFIYISAVGLLPDLLKDVDTAQKRRVGYCAAGGAAIMLVVAMAG